MLTIKRPTQSGFPCEGTKGLEGVKRRHEMNDSSICKHSIRYVNI